jgi:hypothetical protein
MTGPANQEIHIMLRVDTEAILMGACCTLLNHPATQLLVLPARCFHELRPFGEGLYKVLKMRWHMDVDNSRRARPGRRNEKL